MTYERYLLLLIPLLLLLVPARADYCVAIGSQLAMTPNIDESQFINLPLSVEAQLSNGTYLSNTSCYLTTYINDNKVVDYVRPMEPVRNILALDQGFFGLFKDKQFNNEMLTGRLISDDQGYVRYLLPLPDSKYQVNTNYTIYLNCGEWSCTRQQFTVLPATTPYIFYNLPLFIHDNALFVVVCGLFLLILALIVSSVLGAAFGW